MEVKKTKVLVGCGWTKVLHDKPENLSSIPGLRKVGGEN